MSTGSPDISTAYHEAGHAVLALALGRSVTKISILPNQRRQGQCDIQTGSRKSSEDSLESGAVVLLAGLVAEARHTGRYCLDGARQDLRMVRTYSQRRAATEKQIEKLERRWFDKTQYLLDQPGMWTAVELIVAELMKSSTISGRAARHLFEQALSQASRNE